VLIHDFEPEFIAGVFVHDFSPSFFCSGDGMLQVGDLDTDWVSSDVAFEWKKNSASVAENVSDFLRFPLSTLTKGCIF